MQGWELPGIGSPMTEEDFQALSEHLHSLDSIVNGFCVAHSFERMVGPAVGRYPRIRFRRAEGVIQWIELGMELDAFGHRYTTFSPDLPYALGAGAYFDVPRIESGFWRYQKMIVVWPKLAFCDVAERLSEGLETGLFQIARWDEAFLRTKGDRSSVPA